MITSIKGFRQRFIAPYVKQRINLQIRADRFLRAESSPNHIAHFNGILIGARRPRGQHLLNFRLYFCDVLIDGEPLFRRRPSRNIRINSRRRLLDLVGISLADIVWPTTMFDERSSSNADPAKQPEGNAKGLAEFLAVSLSAPETPPDESKTISSNSDSGRRDTNEIERLRRAQQLFNSLRRAFREHRLHGEELRVFLMLKKYLADGVPYNKLLKIIATVLMTDD